MAVICGTPSRVGTLSLVDLMCLSSAQMTAKPNAFTSAFKELDPIPQFKATAKLGGFLETRFKQNF
jgi:hypothetical protein